MCGIEFRTVTEVLQNKLYPCILKWVLKVPASYGSSNHTKLLKE